ncbi:hypothetical protein COU56_05085 [Candidatus Pacearchaeota archaeon CG10_big_fil_rev_8_21_14_0_10_31_9]|nr:MAG: hypothetical protein AUJ62_03405 [Candidatus Pacearchaeota archaeon CG1_02_32_21]PIN91620.1 MAG: hypothetical protein COU56_05085 [Candidatus Pacearchaeota archaeon CG10_big_fil_rev_8_21_14_0_10_31_9]
MAKKYIMLELDDEKLKILSDVLSNKTAKKILEYLADKEASEGEISSELNLPANTVNYNIKNLIEAGLIETGKNWKWSVKGKKILKYKVANKKIIISPKSSSSVNKILGAFAVTGVFALVIKLFGLTQNNAGTNSNYATDYGMELSKVASDAVGSGANSGAGIAQAVQTAQISNVWIWFLLGGIVALVIFMILNWRKLE